MDEGEISKVSSMPGEIAGLSKILSKLLDLRRFFR